MNKTCKECNNNNIKYDKEKGTMLCVNCGLVIEEKIPNNSYMKRNYQTYKRNKTKRVGAPQGLTNVKIYSVYFDPNELDGKNNKKRKNYYRRLNRRNKYRSTQKERALVYCVKLIKGLCFSYELSYSFQNRVCFYLRKALYKNLIRGRTYEDITSACFYIVCRESNIPIGIKEISSFYNLKEGDVYKNINLLIDIFDINIRPPNAEELLHKYCNRLNLSVKYENNIKKILEAYKNKYPFSSKDPKGICAGAIYFANLKNGNLFTLKKIAETCSVTPVTLRSRFNEMEKIVKVK